MIDRDRVYRIVRDNPDAGWSRETLDEAAEWERGNRQQMAQPLRVFPDPMPYDLDPIEPADRCRIQRGTWIGIVVAAMILGAMARAWGL